MSPNPLHPAQAANLTPEEGAIFLRVIASVAAVNTPRKFLAWTRTELQEIFPHEALGCGVAQIGPRGARIRELLCHGLPPAYLDDIRRADGAVMTPVMARWLKEGRPQLFDPASAPWPVEQRWLAVFRKHGMRNIAAHGVRDLGGNLTSYFNFSRIPQDLVPRHAHLLELLVPHLHVALMRSLCSAKATPSQAAQADGPISPCEREILRWLQHGKSNWEIAQILGKSEHTVKNQVRSILIKLQVNNRAQAVAKVLGPAKAGGLALVLTLAFMLTAQMPGLLDVDTLMALGLL